MDTQDQRLFKNNPEQNQINSGLNSNLLPTDQRDALAIINSKFFDGREIKSGEILIEEKKPYAPSADSNTNNLVSTNFATLETIIPSLIKADRGALSIVAELKDDTIFQDLAYIGISQCIYEKHGEKDPEDEKVRRF